MLVLDVVDSDKWQWYQNRPDEMRDEVVNQLSAEIFSLHHQTVAGVDSSSAKIRTELINHFMEQLLGYIMDQFLHHFFTDLHKPQHKVSK